MRRRPDHRGQPHGAAAPRGPGTQPPASRRRRGAGRPAADRPGLGERSAWRRIALTPVLAGPSDLSPADARKLAGFAARHGLAWISTRGAVPAPEVARLLAAPPL
ncbi:hypothetical protein [Planomonospora algeriensis]